MTKEDLMQLKQLLDEQKQEIVGLMDRRFQEQGARFDKKLEEQKREIVQECTANMNIIIESQIQPQMELIFEKFDILEEKMATNERVDRLEERMDDRFDVLEAAVKYHGMEISQLKKAQ